MILFINKLKDKIPLILLSFVLVISHFNNLSFADNLSPEAQLRKLSLQTKGSLPIQEEYLELKASKDKYEFLKEKVNEYLTSDEGVNKTVTRLYETFRFQLADESPSLSKIDIEPRVQKAQVKDIGIFETIAKTLLKKYRSWDRILGAQEFFSKSEIQDKTPSLPKLNESIFYTSEFTERYKQTKFSRSASFARTFFCNDLNPILLNKGSERANIANRGLKTQSAIQRDEIPKKIDPKDSDQEHQKSSCKACHRILDEPQKLFDGEIEKATIVFDDDNGDEHKIEINNKNDFIPLVQNNHHYKRCQVRRILDWYIGTDYFWTYKQIDEWVSKYEELSGDYIEFSKLIVTDPSYSSDAKFLEPTNIEWVQPILNKCAKCHVGEPEAPSMHKLPFSVYGYKGEHQEIVLSMLKDLKLESNGLGATMPPDSAGWKLSEHERINVSRFILDGVRDSNGTPTIEKNTVDDIKSKFSNELLENISQRSPKPSFSNTWKRYIHGYDVLYVLKNLFPDTIETCNIKLNPIQKSILGFEDPNTGMPKKNSPDNFYEDFINTCYQKIFFQQFSIAEKDKVNPVYRWLSLSSLGEEISGESRLGDIPKENLQSWIDDILDQLIGPGVLPTEQKVMISKNIIEIIKYYFADDFNLTTINTAAYWIVYYVIISDEFRIY